MGRHANNPNWHTTSNSFRWGRFMFLRLWRKSGVSNLPQLRIFRRAGQDSINLRSLEYARQIGAFPKLDISAWTLHFYSSPGLYQLLTWSWQEISPCLSDRWCWGLFMEVRFMDFSSTLTQWDHLSEKGPTWMTSTKPVCQMLGVAHKLTWVAHKLTWYCTHAALWLILV